MAGKRFLNPILKIVLCLAGMFTIGYFLYPSILSGNVFDGMGIVRLLVFLGFSYLLIKSVGDLRGPVPRDGGKQRDE